MSACTVSNHTNKNRVRSATDSIVSIQVTTAPRRRGCYKLKVGEEKSSGTCHQSVKGTEAILNVPWREFNMGSMMLRSQKG